jgi:hypothetical protein
MTQKKFAYATSQKDIVLMKMAVPHGELSTAILKHSFKYICVYIYIYVCVCVCVFVSVSKRFSTLYDP